MRRLSPILLMRIAAVVGVPAFIYFLPKARADLLNYEFAFVGIYFIAIIGLNIVTGYSGQISIGHGAFICFGAYTTAILSANYDVGKYWTIPLAGVLTGIFGFLFGLPALRLSGVYLSEHQAAEEGDRPAPYSPSERVVSREQPESQPDVRIRSDAETWVELAKGNRSQLGSVLRRRLRVKGDRRKAAQFARLFQ